MKPSFIKEENDSYAGSDEESEELYFSKDDIQIKNTFTLKINKKIFDNNFDKGNDLDTEEIHEEFKVIN